MTENELKTLIRRTLLDGLRRQGRADIPVIDGHQPTGQGREARAIYFFALGEPRYGWQYRKHRFDPASGQQILTETQPVRSTFQVGGFIEANLLDPARLTALDLTHLAAMLLGSGPAISAFRRAGVGLERITGIRTPFFENDQGRNEAAPSFDITLSHKRIVTLTTPSVEAFEHAFTRV